MNDSAIIELFFGRDETAINHTQKKYGKLLHHITFNILGNVQDTEECVNDTYLGVWHQIPPTRPNSLMAFTCKIARNHALKKFEYNNAKKRSNSDILSFDELENILVSNPIEDITVEELTSHINDFLKTEKEDSRNVFLRKYWFFDSIEEIAERYHFSQSKVKSMLHQTRRKLKKYLAEHHVEVQD